MFRHIAIFVCLFTPSISLSQPYDGCGTDFASTEEAQLNCLREATSLLASIDAIERTLILQISSINQDTSNLSALTADGYFPIDNTESHAKIDSLSDLLAEQRDIMTTISNSIDALLGPAAYAATLIPLDTIASCETSPDGQSSEDCIMEQLDQISTDFCSVQPNSTGTFRVITAIDQAVISCPPE